MSVATLWIRGHEEPPHKGGGSSLETVQVTIGAGVTPALAYAQALEVVREVLTVGAIPSVSAPVRVTQ